MKALTSTKIDLSIQIVYLSLKTILCLFEKKDFWWMVKAKIFYWRPAKCGTWRLGDVYERC